jgi:hypothetical protein
VPKRRAQRYARLQARIALPGLAHRPLLLVELCAHARFRLPLAGMLVFALAARRHVPALQL